MVPIKVMNFYFIQIQVAHFQQFVINQYKASYTTYSVIDGACSGERGLTIDPKSPLIFYLSRALAESTPIELQAKLNYICSTSHTKVDC